MRVAWYGGSGVLFLAASACLVEPAEVEPPGRAPGGRGPVPACDQLAVESLDVRVLDERGVPACDASVVARDGAFERALVAVTADDGCRWYGLAERPGTYEVTAARGGYEPARAGGVVVRAGADGCHVVPARVELRLAPAARGCTALAVPSFDVDVRDGAGAPLCDATVVVRDGDFVQALTPRPGPDGACAWDGLYERPGRYEVTVSMPGYAPVVLRDVVVARDADGCHVAPAPVDVTLASVGQYCDEVYVMPFSFDIRDERGGAVCDATVTVSERGGASVELRGDGSFERCFWWGAPDRPGIYDVTITKPGYEPAEVRSLELTSDGCHVRPVEVAVTLVPVPPPPAPLAPGAKAAAAGRGGAREAPAGSPAGRGRRRAHRPRGCRRRRMATLDFGFGLERQGVEFGRTARARSVDFVEAEAGHAPECRAGHGAGDDPGRPRDRPHDRAHRRAADDAGGLDAEVRMTPLRVQQFEFVFRREFSIAHTRPHCKPSAAAPGTRSAAGARRGACGGRKPCAAAQALPATAGRRATCARAAAPPGAPSRGWIPRRVARADLERARGGSLYSSCLRPRPRARPRAPP